MKKCKRLTVHRRDAGAQERLGRMIVSLSVLSHLFFKALFLEKENCFSHDWPKRYKRKWGEKKKGGKDDHCDTFFKK